MANRSSMSLEVNRQIRAMWEAYYTIYFASGIFIVILAVITIAGNGLLLLAIWKDPFKSFRTPTTFFVIGLALADFITGAIVDPCNAFLSFLTYLNLRRQYKETMVTMVHVASHVSFITMNTSFFLLLALTWSQFAAIYCPYKHKAMVTKRRVIIVVLVIWLYSILVSLLSDFGVSQRIGREIDIHLNTNTVLALLMLAYACLFRAYFRHLNNVRSLEENKANRERRREQERQFTSANLLLVTFLVLFTLPWIVVWHVELYRFPGHKFESPQQRARFAIAQVLTQAFLLVKFAMDPYIYAWRLPKYRQAFKKLITCGRRRPQVQGTGGSMVLSTSGTRSNRRNQTNETSTTLTRS